jgi:hypothetical protein
MAKLQVADLDFRTDGPPQRWCQRCGRDFHDWHVPRETWALLPPEYQPLELCEADFLELLRQAGHPTDDIVVSDEPWRRRQALWERTKDAPANHTQVCFTGDELSENLWCEVVEVLGEREFLVRLDNTSYFDGRLRRGAIFRVRWDGRLLSGITGRPMFEPLEKIKGWRRRRGTARKKVP